MRKAKINLDKIEKEKEKRKAKKRWIFRSILMLIAAACLALAGLFFYNKYQEKKAVEQLRVNFADYEATRQDLQALVDYFDTFYVDETERPEYLFVIGSHLVDSSGATLRMPTLLSDAVENIDENCFTSDQFRWYRVRFNGDRVQFDTDDFNYALVYAPDGAPTYLHSEGEDFDIYVEQIEGPWYHILRMN